MIRVTDNKRDGSRKNHHSLHYLRTKMLLWILLFLFPILVILTVSMRQMQLSYSDQMSANYAQVLKQFTVNIDAVLLTAKRSVMSETKSPVNLVFGDGSELTRMKNMQTAGKHLTEILAPQDKLDVLFVYSDGTLVFVQNYNTSYAKNTKVGDYLEAKFQEADDASDCLDGEYKMAEIDGTTYFYLGYGMDSGIFGCWFSQNSLLEDIRESEMEGVVDAYFTKYGEDVSYLKEGEKHEPYIVTSQELNSAPFVLNVLWERDVIYRTLDRTKHLFMGSALLCILLMVIYMLFLRSSLFVPLRQLTSNIARLREMNVDKIKRSKNESMEFSDVYDSLIMMIQEIKSLRIQVYEEELLAQKTQLELYHLQIRPHFFLNALNNVRCLARDGNIQAADEMASMLMSHLRYVLYGSQFVLVNEELSFVENYIRLQSLQHNKKYIYTEACPEELLDEEIPILIIQILAENAIKHARKDGEPLEIQVCVSQKTVEKLPFLCIVVSDNGVGLPQETLRKLQNAEDMGKERGSHGVGIGNIRKRLGLIYGDRASMFFENREEGGTSVRMQFPFFHEDGREQEV